MVCSGPVPYNAKDLPKIRSKYGFTEFIGYIYYYGSIYKLYKRHGDNNCIYVWLEEDSERNPRGHFTYDTRGELISQAKTKKYFIGVKH